MPTTDVDSRRNNILSAIVEAYVETAQPVGSEVLSQRYGLGVSSATIRNVMADLEAEGLIRQPHTSAGRVPTDKGYRRYVNGLMRELRLTPDEMARIDVYLLHGGAAVDIGLLIERASKLLSQMTHQAAVGITPEWKHHQLKRLELVPLGPHRLLGVVLTQQGFVKSQLFELEESLTGDEVTSLLRFINAELVGLELTTMEELLTHRLLEQTDAFVYLMRRAMQVIHLALETEQERYYLEGTGYLLEQPEFRDLGHARTVIQMLDTEAELLPLFASDERAAGQVRIVIGGEDVRLSAMECSIVQAPYTMQRRIAGSLGIIGPKRMDYPRVVASVSQVAQRVSELLSRLTP